MWTMQKDNVYKLVSTPARREELEQLGFSVINRNPVPAPIRKDPLENESDNGNITAPELQDVSEKRGHNPLQWNGKYITQLYSVQEMRECLRDLGLGYKKNDTRAVLKAKLDNYCKSVKAHRE